MLSMNEDRDENPCNPHRDYLNLHGRLERERPESRIDPKHVRRLAYEVRAAIYALAEIGDPRAEKLIAETMRRWKDIPSAQEGVIEGCYSAMEIIQRRTQNSK